MRQRSTLQNIIFALVLLITTVLSSSTFAEAKQGPKNPLNFHCQDFTPEKVLILLAGQGNNFTGVPNCIALGEIALQLPDFFDMDKISQLGVTHAINCPPSGEEVWQSELGAAKQAVESAIVGAVVVCNNSRDVYVLPLTDTKDSDGIYIQVGGEGDEVQGLQGLQGLVQAQGGQGQGGGGAGGNGALTIWARIGSIAHFTPTLKPIQVTKQISPDDSTTPITSFEFNLVDEAGHEVGNATTSGAGTASFTMKDDFALPPNGSLELTMQEVIPVLPDNWTYDNQKYTVTVFSNGSISYSGNGNIPVFANTYTTPPLEPIQVINRITIKDKSIKNTRFSFHAYLTPILSTAPTTSFEFNLIDEAGHEVGDATISGAGTATFTMKDDFVPPPHGSLELTMQEVIPALPDNWAYDKQRYTVTVFSNGSISYSGNGNIPVFANTYTIPTLKPIQVTNRITNNDRSIANTRFSFQLENEAGQVVGKAVIIGEGKKNFEMDPNFKIPFNGSIKLTMREVIPNSTGYWTYDKNTYSVTVSYDGSISYSTERGIVPVFSNTFQRPSKWCWWLW